ncbi:MAG TPA: hypothetical protein VM532_13185, partial [Burkholderiales bacterium]|nr:hypothetical protein [Burkholderiales bacterium]
GQRRIGRVGLTQILGKRMTECSGNTGDHALAGTTVDISIKRLRPLAINFALRPFEMTLWAISKLPPLLIQ